MSKLVIENVDKDLLVEQIQSLADTLNYARIQGWNPQDTEMCEGLLIMLETWKDSCCTPVKILVKEWYDRVNGNSYWSSRVYVAGELLLVLPFQYGYDRHGVDISIQKLADKLCLPSVKTTGYSKYCTENNIHLDYTKICGCLKREVVAHGTE